jgi:hypothetical protein
LIDFEQFFLLVHFQFFISIDKSCRNGFDFVVDLVSLLLELTFPLGVLFDFLIIITNLSNSFEILVIVFDDSDVRLLILIFKLVFAFFRFFLVRVFFIFILVMIAFLLFFFHFLLLLHLADPLAFSNLVIPDNPFPHFIVIGVDKLPKNFFLFLILLFILLIQHLILCDFGGEL